MALVAYDNSDSSDFDDDPPSLTPLNETKVEVPVIRKSPNHINSEENEASSLFNLLPQPATKKTSVHEEEDEFLHKKEEITNIVKPKARIMVPSLSDFKDVENRTATIKPKLNNGKKSGLLSILPQPKNAVSISTKSLIPQVISQKPKNDTAKKKNPLSLPLKNTEPATKSLSIDYSDESDNDDEVQNDFFSINKVVEIPVEELPLDIETKSNEISEHNLQVRQQRSIESYFKQDEIKPAEFNNEADYNGIEESNSNHERANEAEQPNSNEVLLDDEAILKLCGTRGKRKREDIQIVDVNQQEVLADAREWVLKGLMDDTSKRVSSSKRRGNEPTSQQKRKHQITYLAHQAKANEAELQNQWANNRVTKRKTQSKYGF